MFNCLIKAKKIKIEDISFYFYRQREGSIVFKKNERNSMHVLYGLSTMLSEYKLFKNKNKIINMYLLNLYFNNTKKLKMIDKNLLKEILFLKKFTLKGYIKIIYLLIFSFKYKKINIDSIKKILFLISRKWRS